MAHNLKTEGEAPLEVIEAAVGSACKSFVAWSRSHFEERVTYVRVYEKKLKQHAHEMAITLSHDTGKPLWESKQEVEAMIHKIALSISAYQERCPDREFNLAHSILKLHHKPHGVVAVFGPFNFPGHLPNGHIVPALLAGNTIVFKGSELTPSVSHFMTHLWEHLPEGVLNSVQGGPKAGAILLNHPKIDGLFFTGSYQTGLTILKNLAEHPEKIIALEMGGNNPLIFWDASNLEAAAHLTIQSAFLTSGQRCTCARRLIMPDNAQGEAFLKVLIKKASEIVVGFYTQTPEPFMGPVIHLKSAERLLKAQELLIQKKGVSLLKMDSLKENTPLLSPGIIDVTHVVEKKDEELFGPFLQVIRVPNFESALDEANNTQYGLVASIITEDIEKFKQFYHTIKAGVINWNTPTTGASSKVPFGGVKRSGNYRPSGYYATDYCAYPVASMERPKL